MLLLLNYRRNKTSEEAPMDIANVLLAYAGVYVRLRVGSVAGRRYLIC